jgi:hypothetical protein
MKRGAAVAPVARGRKSTYEIEKGLRLSLESVDNGLKQFLLSLKESKMVEGLQGYRNMQLVLVQQRLWAHNHSRVQLLPQFRSIAKTAAELHRIFSSYAEVMRPLKELDRISAVSARAAAAPELPAAAQPGPALVPPQVEDAQAPVAPASPVEGTASSEPAASGIDMPDAATDS